jgi:hypothetical protein
MAEHPTRRVPRFSPESSANIYDPMSRIGPNTTRKESTQLPNSRWKTLLVEMLKETNQAKRELAAVALEEAIYERHRELTDQRAFNSESMAERMKMKEAFMRLLDVRSQLSFPDRAPLPMEFRHVPRRAPDWGRSEAEAADWRRLLLQMLGENDHVKLERITAALEEAIFTRYQQLATVETLEATEERTELQLACDRLTLVRINVLGQRNQKKAG